MVETPFNSPTFDRDASFRLDEPVGALSISPSGRDVVLGSKQGLHIIDLDNPYAPPRYLSHETRLEVADIQWSPFASRDYWVVSTSDSAALVWNLEAQKLEKSIDHVLWGREGHNRAISDINFSAHDPDLLATCSIDSFVLAWDLRDSRRPCHKFADWEAGAQQVKWNRKDPHILASAHNNRLHIWDDRKGVTPLHSIEAHQTKIYGIDWNRTDSTCILTCSLDKTIKLWNFSDFKNGHIKPLRTMHTDFPVWRARHTPFGAGVVAMPQRDDNCVHLYDRRTYRISDRNSQVQSAYQFDGHRSNVREFLWRYRGSVEDGRDNRDWQLVTWGADQQLLLHRVTDDMTRKVGHVKGDPTPGGMTFTRRGATYRSFHEAGAHDPHSPQKRQALGLATSQKRDLGVSKHIESPTSKLKGKSGQVDALTWIKGVKLRKHGTEIPATHESVDSIDPTKQQHRRDMDDVGAEIAEVSESLAKAVEFSEIDVKRGRAVISFEAPWADKGRSCWFRCRTFFPNRYPSTDEPLDIDVDFPQTITEATKTRLTYQLHAILDAHAAARKQCLEAALRFLLGHWNYERSCNALGGYKDDAHPSKEDYLRSFDANDDEDDDDLHNPLATSTDLDGSGMITTANKFANQNVPIPKACGAVFAANGRLVCFFPFKEKSPFDAFKAVPKPFNDPDEKEKQKIFREFQREHFTEDQDWEDVASSSAGSSSSSPSSSEDSDDSLLFTQNPITGYRKGAMAFYDFRSDGGGPEGGSIGDLGPIEGYQSGLSYVAIHDVDELLTSKRALASEYLIKGSGQFVCEHNAEVAFKHGFDELAHTWRLVALLLDSNVPLERIKIESSREALALIDIDFEELDRHDSGTEDVTSLSSVSPRRKITGRVKWGDCPLGSANRRDGKPSLIEKLFRRYEQEKDVQMLAMLSCVLAPAPETDAIAGPLTLKDDDSNKPFAIQYPAFSPPYFASASFARGLDGSSAEPLAGNQRRTTRLQHPAGLTINAPSTGPSTLQLQRTASSLSSSFSSSLKNPLSWLSTGSSPQDGAMAARLVENDEALSDDGEEDDDFVLDTAKVRIRYTNQDYFEESKAYDKPFLRGEDTAKHIAWRASYAKQLGAWGLFTARATMLKFNDSSKNSGTSPALDGFAVSASLRCRHCGELTSHEADTRRFNGSLVHETHRLCTSCGRGSRLPQCAICMEVIGAFAVVCCRCGHCAHSNCLQLWKSQEGDLAVECPGGCGCECAFSDGAGPMHLVGDVEDDWRSIVRDIRLGQSQARRESAWEFMGGG